ncbi:MAG: hypothetical protein C0613_10675 [Desulfobulbaceae bacterium]|nr:MAG: hypothetical protein C0613_10675 [Desulfobulbaceae bacterium]
MPRLFTALLSLICLIPAMTSATTLLELEDAAGGLTARLTITGDTLLVNDQGEPWPTPADQLLCTLTVTAPETTAVTMPSLTGAAFGDFTLLDQGEVEVRRTGNDLVHQRQWLVEPYNPGAYRLPGLLIRAVRGNETFELSLAQPEITVHAVAADNSAGGDILPPLAPKERSRLPLILSSLGLGLAALVIWLLRRRHKRGPRPLPPKQRALNELARAEELSGRQRIERLAYILRCYLASRFELQCLEQTYEEYAPSINNCAAIPAESRALFLAVLERCDQLKFTNSQPEPREAERLTKEIREGLAACPLAGPGDKTCGRW